MAGREAGEGRTRPGRSSAPRETESAEVPPDEDEEPDAVVVPVHTPRPSASPEPGRTPRHALDGPAVRQVRQVSLGTGIALVGLGLGFLALRMRRTN